MTIFLNGLSLGLGLLSIGRPWGVVPKPIPSEEQVSALLDTALKENILLWDTAPAYVLSEARIGRYLQNKPASEVSRVLVTTKFGECATVGSPQSETVKTFTDHSYRGLMTSLDQSLNQLRNIHAIQVHKSTLSNVVAVNTQKALQAAKNYGIKYVGASVSDVATGLLAIESGCYDFLQFPFSLEQKNMEAIVEKTNTIGMPVLVNRPFAMGALVSQDENLACSVFDALLFLKQHIRTGAILTGTANADHLRTNVKAFRAVSEAAVFGLGKISDIR